MEIQKELRIVKVEETLGKYNIFLEDTMGTSRSELYLDEKTRQRYALYYGNTILGKYVIVSLVSSEPPMETYSHLKPHDQNKWNIIWSEIKNDQLGIKLLEHREFRKPSLHSRPSFNSIYKLWTLELESFGRTHGSLNPLPCPFYKINLVLDKEEYEVCLTLPAPSIFTVDFHLR